MYVMLPIYKEIFMLPILEQDVSTNMIKNIPLRTKEDLKKKIPQILEDLSIPKPKLL